MKALEAVELVRLRVRVGDPLWYRVWSPLYAPLRGRLDDWLFCQLHDRLCDPFHALAYAPITLPREDT